MSCSYYAHSSSLTHIHTNTLLHAPPYHYRCAQSSQQRRANSLQKSRNNLDVPLQLPLRCQNTPNLMRPWVHHAPSCAAMHHHREALSTTSAFSFRSLGVFPGATAPRTRMARCKIIAPLSKLVQNHGADRHLCPREGLMKLAPRCKTRPTVIAHASTML